MPFHRLSAKLFLADPAGLDLGALSPIFQGWIRDHRLPGILIDVADYRHVPSGPGVLLVGHEGDWSLDAIRSPLGLLHVRKRGFAEQADFRARLRETIQGVIVAAKLLAAEPSLAGKVSFTPDRIDVGIQDRLRAPNTAESFDAIKPDVEAVLKDIYDGASVKIERGATDPREGLSFRVTLSGAGAGVLGLGDAVAVG